MDPTKLTVAQLKAELVSLELPTTGLKAVLLERLQSALVKPAEASPAVAEAQEEISLSNEPANPAKRALEDALPETTPLQALPKKAFRPTRPASLPSPAVPSPAAPTPDAIVLPPQELPITASPQTKVVEEIVKESMQVDSAPVETTQQTSEKVAAKMEVDTPAKIVTSESFPSASASTSKLPSDTPPPSESLYVGNLVRPFTTPQLREMLSEYGEIVSSSFWIDSIKTHCYFTYSTLASSEAAHAALSNTAWPSANTQSLIVSFVPTSQLPLLVAEEEQARLSQNRVRLELHCSRSDSEGRQGEWNYDLRPFQATREGHAGVRGLASAVPSGDRVSLPDPRRSLPSPYSAPLPPPRAPPRLASNPYINQLPTHIIHSAPPDNAPKGPKGMGVTQMQSRTIPVASPIVNFNSTLAIPRLYWCERTGGKGISARGDD